MRPGREIDTRIANEVFGFRVKVKQKELWEEAPLGDRPLRKYSKEMTAAWEVAEKMNMSLLPIESNAWFAFVGQGTRWKSPEEFLETLQTKKFAQAGAAAHENAAMAICLAALKAVENRKAFNETSEVASVSELGDQTVRH